VLPSVGDKKPQISLSRGVVLSQSTFHLVTTALGTVRVYSSGYYAGVRR